MVEPIITVEPAGAAVVSYVIEGETAIFTIVPRQGAVFRQLTWKRTSKRGTVQRGSAYDDPPTVGIYETTAELLVTVWCDVFEFDVPIYATYGWGGPVGTYRIMYDLDTGLPMYYQKPGGNV